MRGFVVCKTMLAMACFALAGLPGSMGCCSLHIGPSYYQNPEPAVIHQIPGITEASEDIGDRKPAQITASSKTLSVSGTGKNSP